MHSFIEVNRELSERKIPNIVSAKSYALYLLMPTLVYQEKYPLLDKIRIRYILEKLFEIAVLLMILIKHIRSYWMEVFTKFQMNQGIPNIFFLYFEIAVPIILTYYCLFYFMFELYLNICGEVTRFGDRQFYLEFWNITTYGEYGRYWNTITHEFLYQHLFKVLRINWKLSSTKCAFITTLFSAVMHEYFMLCLIGQLNIFMINMMSFYCILSVCMGVLKGTEVGAKLTTGLQLIGTAINFIPYIVIAIDTSIN